MFAVLGAGLVLVYLATSAPGRRTRLVGNLGLEADGDSPIGLLRSGTELPVTCKAFLTTTIDRQTSVKLKLIQGPSVSHRLVKGSKVVASPDISVGVWKIGPLGSAPMGTRVEATISMDTDGAVAVSAAVGGEEMPVTALSGMGQALIDEIED